MSKSVVDVEQPPVKRSKKAHSSDLGDSASPETSRKKRKGREDTLIVTEVEKTHTKKKRKDKVEDGSSGLAGTHNPGGVYMIYSQ